MRLYELGLQKSCYKVANRFVDEEMQLAGMMFVPSSTVVGHILFLVG